jgi:hypothetical protein
MNRDTILAIDLGRYKSVVRISSYSVRRYDYRTVDSTTSAICSPSILVQPWSSKPAPTLAG